MNQSSGNKPVIHVRMFGGFTITMDEKAMCDSDNRSRKAWSLLSYLIIKRRGDVSINELFHAIWQDGVQDNPYGALKTLVFRVRKMLEAAGFPSQDLILSQKGAYMWNPAWETEVDTDRFESLCRRILDPEGDGKNMRGACLEAFELYRGIFLPRSSEESWVGPMAAYYHTLYQKLVVYMAEKLIQDATNHLLKGHTSFVIAHRLSTIRQADLILVVKDGKIIERGSHPELLEQKGYYYELYSRQFEEEAAMKIYAGNM